MSGDITVGDERTIKVTIRGEQVANVIAKAPRVAYYWLRDFLGASFGKHRQAWLQAKGIKFGRGGAESRAIRVPEVNAGGEGAPQPSEVLYQVHPAERRFKTPAEASAAIRELTGRASTGSRVLEVHEFGKNIHSNKKWMAIPIKTRVAGGHATPERWRAAFPSKTLRLIRSRRGNELLLYEVRRVGARGRPAKGQPRETRERMQLRFVLRRDIKMLPKLHMYRTWDSLRGFRDQLWAKNTARMADQMNRGIDS